MIHSPANGEATPNATVLARSFRLEPVWKAAPTAGKTFLQDLFDWREPSADKLGAFRT
ncbi:hypothetical protein [Novosphingobium lindaniclasticum]|uniref:hypothetical protein n=1 Tax=Novosphingobium lindaniclasticum TaxID=1329895 RepID=UPI0013626CC4|nr:hypothetical protein [Novosphingobium lindaniclasticum]